MGTRSGSRSVGRLCAAFLASLLLFRVEAQQTEAEGAGTALLLTKSWEVADPTAEFGVLGRQTCLLTDAAGEKPVIVCSRLTGKGGEFALPDHVVIEALDGETGELRWSMPLQPPKRAQGSLPIADIGDRNGDGHPDAGVVLGNVVIALSGRTGEQLGSLVLDNIDEGKIRAAAFSAPTGKGEDVFLALSIKNLQGMLEPGHYTSMNEEVKVVDVTRGVVVSTIVGGKPFARFGESLLMEPTGKVYGKPAVLVGAPVFVHDGHTVGALLAYGLENGALLKQVTGTAGDGSGFGSSLAWLPDLNGDSLPEIAIGCPSASTASGGQGKVLICDGKSLATLSIIEAERAEEVLGCTVQSTQPFGCTITRDLLCVGVMSSSLTKLPGAVRVYALPGCEKIGEFVETVGGIDFPESLQLWCGESGLSIFAGGCNLMVIPDSRTPARIVGLRAELRPRATGK